MKKIAFFLIFFSLFIMNGCIPGPGISDFSFDLPNDYQVVRSSSHDVKVVPKSGWTSDNQIIPSKVIEVVWDDNYILAKQNRLMREKPNDPNRTYEIPDTSKEYYWILDTSKKESFGPYDLKQFSEIRKSLNIDEKLKLKPVKEYRN